MRTIFASIMLLLSMTAYCQTFKAPEKQKAEFTDTTTTFKYELKDDTYNVYKAKSGAFYIWKKSKKSGKLYKMYLPKEVQIQMGRKYEK